MILLNFVAPMKTIMEKTKLNWRHLLKEYNAVKNKMLQFSISLTTCSSELILVKLKLCSVKLQLVKLEEINEDILNIKKVLIETRILLMYIDKQFDIIARPIPPIIN